MKQESSVTIWAAKDSDDDERIYLFYEKPADYSGYWESKSGSFDWVHSWSIPELTYENSPQKIELELVDNE
jgi:hypothetical protein